MVGVIPRSIHQLWIGPHPAPAEWIDTWRDAHPDFTHTLWDEAGIDGLNLVNRHIYDYYCERGLWAGASDVVRYELLYRFGGVWIDADTLCLRSIADAPFMSLDRWFVSSPNLPNRVSAGFMGAKPGDEVFAEIINHCGELTVYEPSWDTCGGTAVTKVLKSHEAHVLPGYTFYDVDIHGNRVPGDGPRYGHHYAGTTHGLYG